MVKRVFANEFELIEPALSLLISQQWSLETTVNGRKSLKNQQRVHMKLWKIRNFLNLYFRILRPEPEIVMILIINVFGKVVEQVSMRILNYTHVSST